MLRKIYQKPSKPIKALLDFMTKHPLASFFIFLVILLGLLGLSRYLKVLKQQQTSKPETSITKESEIYSVGQLPYVKVQAQVDKAGVITVVAQTGGVVQRLYVSEGDRVSQGQRLVRLSTNYQGGSLQSVSRKIAQEQYQNYQESYNEQKAVFAAQRDLASLAEDNSKELAEISRQSAVGTGDLLNYNKELLDQLNQAVALDPTNTTLKVSRNQIKAAYESAAAQLRQLEYQTAKDKPPLKTAETKKELTLNQLAVQEKAFELQGKLLKLQLDLAYIQESLLYPAAPFSGQVQQVFVKKGELVSPGTPIATVVGDANEITAVAYVSKNIAGNVSATYPSEIDLGEAQIELRPTFVSNEATRGTLYTILYDIPAKYSQLLANKEYVTVRVPLGYASSLTKEQGVYVPIDAVHNTQGGSFLLVVDDRCQAEAKQVELGSLYGQFIQVYGDLAEDEKVVLNRNVVSGDKIKNKDLNCS